MKKILFLTLLLPFCMKSINSPVDEWQEITHHDNTFRTPQNAETFICKYTLEGEESFATVPENTYGQANLITGDDRCPQSFDIYHNQIPFMICPNINNYQNIGIAQGTSWCLYSTEQIQEWNIDTEEWE